MNDEFDSVLEYLKVFAHPYVELSFKPCDDALPIVNITDRAWDDDGLVMEFATIDDRQLFKELWHDEKLFRLVMDNAMSQGVLAKKVR